MRTKGLVRLVVGGALVLASSGCAALSHGFVNAAGPVAADQRHLFVVLACVLVFVAGPVLLLVPLFAWHYRLSNTRHAYRPNWSFSWPVEALIWIPPTAIVIGLAVLLWHHTIRDDPYRPLPGGPPVEVQAIALDWKWVFVYPGEGIAAVDRLTIPAGRPVRIRLTSGTVMQSLMIPQLAGQVYAMAGMTTQLHIMASRPGRYRGANTQYNGDGFAHQRFDVVALPTGAYDRWRNKARAAHRPLDAATWRRLSARSVIARPVVFSSVTPQLFDRVVAQAGDHGHRKDHR
ncbi:cytochrome ubiquinol oxidase subunit II [Arthrobacter sp. TPD3018]|uniref:COX aromatic rich motif-containing protein n=1 Tax=Bacteria TaxID=2 RepID=UPI000D510F9F|nr:MULTISPECIES: COX aromatic rich motif-containing protein [Bacteria]PVE59488.1 cytochrome ubiquinol oxidase subunit II [Sphingomonas sp. TPD3009]PVE61008.1 cytochrome ubiquinol oxidase subunit II [Arthrobacter sp. TPD3018]PVE86077.1 cytochrome ubiquinol oxidase subunit II [Sphingomonas melonis]